MKRYNNKVPADCPSSEIVDTTIGPVRGAIVNDVNTFLGIPYGKPPVGDLRFLPPERPERASEVRDCRAFPHAALQWQNDVIRPTLPGDVQAALEELFVRNVHSEDCLGLSVWSADLKPAELRPVMVWLHMGAFTTCCSSFPLTHGENLAREQDLVVVTVNHRLNVFGFLDLSSYGDERFAQSGNAGMLDLVLALQWVQDNIAAFGGDPNNVTIAGHSGGGFKVSTLLNMPAAKGLFHKAIIQSGVPRRLIERTQARHNAGILLNAFGGGESAISELQSLTGESLVKKIKVMSEEGEGRLLAWWQPVVDGVDVVRHPLDQDNADLMADVPILIGYNEDEFTLYSMGQAWWGEIEEETILDIGQSYYGDNIKGAYDAARLAYPKYSLSQIFDLLQNVATFIGPTLQLADLATSVNEAPVYFYTFGRKSPLAGGLLGAMHLMEAAFLFGTLDRVRSMVGSDPANADLAETMGSAWAAFMRSGNPNIDKLPAWPRYQSTNRQGLRLDIESGLVADPLSSVRSLCKEYKPRLVPRPNAELLEKVRLFTSRQQS